MACETVCTFFYVFLGFFQNPKKHDFLRFFELLHTFSRTVPIGYGVRSTSVNFASVKIDYNAKYDPYKSNGERDDTGVKNLPQAPSHERGGQNYYAFYHFYCPNAPDLKTYHVHNEHYKHRNAQLHKSYSVVEVIITLIIILVITIMINMIVETQCTFCKQNAH